MTPQLVDQSIAVRPTYIRDAQNRQLPAYTGLSRSKLYELISGDNPPVRSISLKRGDQQRATRLINVLEACWSIWRRLRRKTKTSLEV